MKRHQKTEFGSRSLTLFWICHFLKFLLFQHYLKSEQKLITNSLKHQLHEGVSVGHWSQKSSNENEFCLFSNIIYRSDVVVWVSSEYSPQWKYFVLGKEKNGRTRRRLQGSLSNRDDFRKVDTASAFTSKIRWMISLGRCKLRFSMNVRCVAYTRSWILKKWLNYETIRHRYAINETGKSASVWLVTKLDWNRMIQMCRWGWMAIFKALISPRIAFASSLHKLRSIYRDRGYGGRSQQLSHFFFRGENVSDARRRFSRKKKQLCL